MEYLSIFSPNVGKYGPEQLQIQTFLTQCKCVSLSSEPCMTRPLGLDKCNSVCNVVDDLSTKLCVTSKNKI